MKWKAGLMILAALSLIFAGQSRLVRYLVEEAFTVLLGIAIILTLAWIALAALLLLWQKASCVFLQLKQIVRRGSSVADRHLVPHK